VPHFLAHPVVCLMRKVHTSSCYCRVVAVIVVVIVVVVVVTQTEKQSLRSQCESLQHEQSISNKENSRLLLHTHELEKENSALRGRAEEAVHRGKLDVSNVRVEMLRERGDIERERDKLHSQLQGYSSS